jgi:hypothetical protein
MKKSLFSGIVALFILTSCEKNDNEVFLKIGSGFEYRYSDIELYDTSAHVIYFKKVHDEFKKIETGSFTFLDKGDPIYTGSFWPGYSSSGPTGPFIMSPPSFYGNYALKIDNWHTGKPDVRNDPKMIELLKKNNLFHSGLAISSDLLILDFEKTGPALFHYFTNGIYIYDLNHNEVFSSTIQFQAPDPSISWKIDWLSELKSGDSKEYTINYAIKNPINPGVYYTTFEFPGIGYQVPIDQLYQGTSRIWFGDIQLIKTRTIN